MALIGGSFRPAINLATLEIRSKRRKKKEDKHKDATKRRRFGAKYARFFFLSTLLKLPLYLPRRRPPSIVSLSLSLYLSLFLPLSLGVGINFDNM